MSHSVPLDIVERILEDLNPSLSAVEQYLTAYNKTYRSVFQPIPESPEGKALLQCRLVSRSFCELSSKLLFRDVKVRTEGAYTVRMRRWLNAVDSSMSTILIHTRTFSFRVQLPQRPEENLDLLCRPEHPLNVLVTSLSRLLEVAQRLPPSSPPLLQSLKIDFSPSQRRSSTDRPIDWSGSTVPSDLSSTVKALCASENVTRALWIKSFRGAPLDLFHGLKAQELLITDVRERVELGIEWKRLPSGSLTPVRLPQPDPDFVPLDEPESLLTAITTDGTLPLSPSRHKIRDLTFIVDSDNDEPAFILRHAAMLETFCIRIAEAKSPYHTNTLAKTKWLREACTKASFDRLKKLTIKEGELQLDAFLPNPPVTTLYINYHFSTVIQLLESFQAFNKAPFLDEIVMIFPFKTGNAHVECQWSAAPHLPDDQPGWAVLDSTLIQLIRGVRKQNRHLRRIHMNIQVLCQPEYIQGPSHFVGPGRSSLMLEDLQRTEQYWRRTGWPLASSSVGGLLPGCDRFFPGVVSLSTSFTSIPSRESVYDWWKV